MTRNLELRTSNFELLIVALLLLAIALAGCAAKPEEPTLKIGLLPILDVLPMYVAEQEGYFQAQGLKVELVPFASALERDTAFQTGQIDGQVNDLVSTALLNKEADRARVVRVAMRARPDKAMFAILASGTSPIQTPADLKGVEIAISHNTIIEYVTDQMLRAEGLAADEVAKTEVTKIPVRLELLAKGQVQAATLPEPLASLAVKEGARIVVDDRSHTEFSQSVVTFRLETLKARSQTVKKFLAAYEQAVQALNTNPARYQNLLIEQGRVPPPVQDSFTMPVFPTASITNRPEFEQVIAWMLEKGLLDKAMSYQQAVDGGFLPK